MTTIEGGMISTNNKKIYELLEFLDLTECLEKSKNIPFERKMKKKYNYLSPQFIFLYPTLNFRNNEIGACIGLSQLKN